MTETVNISKANALKAYQMANKETKEILETLIGKEVLSQKITDRVKTIEDAIALYPVSDNLKTLLTYNGIDEIMIGAKANALLQLVVAVLNEGWTPNWDDSQERKWEPWFYLDNPSGFRFDVASYVHTDSSVGSRLCFKTKELCEYAANQFLDLYKENFTLNNK